MYLIKFLILPNSLFLRKSVPIFYIILLQLLTGIPKPEYVQNMNFSSLAVRFSEEIYNYPYWLQDLSHVPLFFILTWLLHWFVILPDNKLNNFRYSVVLFFSYFYAFFNEAIQVFIPDRFPSLEDLLMNLSGVLLGKICYKLASKKFTSDK
jgi:VanZ family protein